jgi:hypothetical protein
MRTISGVVTEVNGRLVVLKLEGSESTVRWLCQAHEVAGFVNAVDERALEVTMEGTKIVGVKIGQPLV